ncbi:hypothetical protein Tco_0295197 [Tanacetum coccineum]
MCNYLKNMAGYKHNQLRHKSFDDIQKLFDKALKRVNTFVPMDTKKVEGSKAKAAGSETRVEESSKRAGEELDRESTKKQKITRDARKIYYHITRADGSTKVYMRFEDMLKMFDRKDLEVLYKIVKDRFKSTKPVGDNRVLWGNLMTMFEPSAGDEMWREQGRYLIKSWKLIDSCGIHCLMLESMYIYMLVEKERQKQVLKTENPGKRIAFLENKHSKSFAKWLRKEVERELAISKESVSETVRWISYGPRATVVKYDAYNINGYTFRTKCHDGKVYQNSGVSVEAIDLHISKEVATTRQAFYYGVLQEIWVLDYRFRQIPLFKCDWVNHRAGGVKRDNLGYTLVDLNNLGHKVDPFILASQARQVFYVKDQIDKKLSIVFKTPPKNYKDTYDEVDEEFSTVIHQRNDNILPCVNRRDLGNESRDDYYRTDCGGSWVRDTKDIRIASNLFLRPYPHTILYHITDFDLAVNISQSFNWEDVRNFVITGRVKVPAGRYVVPTGRVKVLASRFWGSKSGCNESDVKPSWKDIKKAKACMLAKAQASKASSKAKVEACGSKVKVEACGSKAKLQASTKTLIVKSHVPITNCILGLANAKTWDAIKGKTFGVQIPPTMTFAEVKIGKRNLRKIIKINSDSSEDRKWASKATAPIFYGPSTQGLLDAYGYNIIEEYLSWNYFPSTDNESTDMETTDKRNFGLL